MPFCSGVVAGSSTSLILAHDIVAARKRGMKIVAVDPRRVGIPGQADVLLQVRPGTDGALALALIDVVITDKLYDEAFVRQWTNGSFLVRADSGTALTEADLTTDGSPQRFVAWDETTGAPVVYDPSVGSFEAQSVRPALFGRAPDKNQRRQRNSLPADICRAGEACRTLQPGGVRRDYLCARRQGQASRAVACKNRPVSMYMYNGVGQHTNATQTNRAIAVLYALLGDFDLPGGNVVFPKAPMNAVSGKELLPKEAAAQRIGRERKPLGPPAKPGNCAAYDIFTAILEDRPYPVKALLNFGSNTVMSTGDSERARTAFRAVDFAVAAELFMTPTAATLRLCAAGHKLSRNGESELTTSNIGAQGKLHLQYRPPVVTPLAERRSDTWIIFELAKRLGFGPDFWDGDIGAAYEYELASTGLSLNQVKASAGGITLRAAPRYGKYSVPTEKGAPRGFNTPDKKVELYSHSFAAHGYPAAAGIYGTTDQSGEPPGSRG